MLKINLSNIEEKIFQNSELRKKFPEFAFYFSQWDLGNKQSYFKNHSKQYVIKLLNSINPRHLGILEDYFQDIITVNKVEDKFMKNLSSTLLEIEPELNKLNKGCSDFCIYRENEKLFISLWK